MASKLWRTVPDVQLKEQSAILLCAVVSRRNKVRI